MDEARKSKSRDFSSRSNPRLVIAVAGIGLVAMVFAAFGTGAVSISPSAAIDTLGESMGIADFGDIATAVEKSILINVRLPRVLVGLMAGALMALTGVMMQAFFRNPLADPALIGVATGGAFGAVGMIVLGATVFGGFSQQLLGYLLPVAAFLGSLGASAIIFTLARRDGVVNVATMLLCGIAVNAVAGAGIGFLSFLADDAQLRDITFWSLGSLGAASWGHVQAILPAAIIVIAAACFLPMSLNALLLGDAEAIHLGFRVEILKLGVLLLTCLGAGAVVATCGVIGFIGLVAPHASRLLVGPDHRFVLPLAALIGAVLLLGADIIARTAVSPAELPIGVLTAIIGGPVFLWLLRRDNGSALNAGG
jgi:iron complex transport system permease protein